MLRIENLTAGYGRHPVLRDVTLNIEEGHMSALIGQNGSGKTTLMRCINAVLRPGKGRVSVAGRDIGRLKRSEIARLISMVPQTNQATFPFSCLEMILMGGAARLKAWSSPGSVETDRARQLGREIGISELLNRAFNHLSGGEKQLVMLARALYQGAPIMLLDEPNAHLDFCNQHRIMALVREIAVRRRVTVLVTLHDPNLALYYCDDVIGLREGRVVIQGPTKGVLDDRALKEVLGHNIRIDATASGIQVVVPSDTAPEGEKPDVPGRIAREKKVTAIRMVGGR
ncbi:MAG: ABC transporter ATP-binding protein [Desulfatiglandales bacterium]